MRQSCVGILQFKGYRKVKLLRKLNSRTCIAVKWDVAAEMWKTIVCVADLPVNTKIATTLID